MRSRLRRRGPTTRRWLGLALLGIAWIGCTPAPSENPLYAWPEDATAMSIWAVLPGETVVWTRDGDSLVIRWNDAEVAGTQPTVSLALKPDDPNFDDIRLASGLDAVADGPADEWIFDGRDSDGNFVPVDIYNVEYTIDDGAGNTETAVSAGTITVPFRFLQPASDINIFQTSGLAVEWEEQGYGILSRLDIGLTTNLVEPADANAIVWIGKPNGMTFLSDDQTLFFDGTVYDATTLEEDEPNSSLVEPGTYVLVARITPIGSGRVGFFIPSQARVTISPDP